MEKILLTWQICVTRDVIPPPPPPGGKAGQGCVNVIITIIVWPIRLHSQVWEHVSTKKPLSPMFDPYHRVFESCDQYYCEFEREDSWLLCS